MKKYENKSKNEKSGMITMSKNVTELNILAMSNKKHMENSSSAISTDIQVTKLTKSEKL